MTKVALISSFAHATTANSILACIQKGGLRLAQHLSRNETKHVYMETEEERMLMEIQYLATLDDQKRTAKMAELRSAASVRKKANKLLAILNSDPAFHAVEQLVHRGGHFMEMPEMNVRWLQGHLCGPHGGVGSLRWLTLRLTFSFLSFYAQPSRL